MKMLWILPVWPEPESSAAGFRCRHLMEACLHDGYTVRASSPCADNPYRIQLEELGIATSLCGPNDPRFDEELLAYQPDIVIFDRFMLEEQFSWRVRQHCPEALRILDTCDLHSLRRARQAKLKECGFPFVLGDGYLRSEDAMRELAAIYRSDLAIMTSDYEIELLKNYYQVPEEQLFLSRFFYEKGKEGLPFTERKNFIIIGNFHHAPNEDSVRFLHEELWLKIRESCAKAGHPDVELHVYGAYPKEVHRKLDNPEIGFYVKGWTPNAQNTLGQYRVNLAPLRFGAGIKGKITDGWAIGTPCLGTPFAAEGMTEGQEFGGFIREDWQDFAGAAMQLYTDELAWKKAAEQGRNLLKALYSKEKNSRDFLEKLNKLTREKVSLRVKNITGEIIWQQQLRCTEYFSRWLELKSALTLLHSSKD